MPTLWCYHTQFYITRKVFSTFQKKGEWHDCILQRGKQGEGYVPACLSMALACLCCSNAWPWSWLQAPKHAMYDNAWTSCCEIPCSSVILKESSDDHANHHYHSSHEICIICISGVKTCRVQQSCSHLFIACFWILPSCKAISVFSVTIPAACLLTVAQSAAGTWFSTLPTHCVSRQKTLFHCLLPTRTWYVDIDRKRNSTRLTLKNLAQAPYFGLVCTKCHQQSVITTASMSICPWQPFVTPVGRLLSGVASRSPTNRLAWAFFQRWPPTVTILVYFVARTEP